MRRTRLMKTLIALIVTTAMAAVSLPEYSMISYAAEEDFAEDLSVRSDDETAEETVQGMLTSEETEEVAEPEEVTSEEIEDAEDSDETAEQKEAAEMTEEAVEADLAEDTDELMGKETEPEEEIGNVNRYDASSSESVDAPLYMLKFTPNSSRCKHYYLPGKGITLDECFAYEGDISAIEVSNPDKLILSQNEDGEWLLDIPWQFYNEEEITLTITWGDTAHEPTVYAVEGVDMENRCGDNMVWIKDGYSDLYICGAGDMWDFESREESPFHDQYWGTIFIDPTITSIGDRAFEGAQIYGPIVMTGQISGDTGRYCFYTGNLKRIGNMAFKDNRCYIRLIIGEALETIETDAFTNTTMICKWVYENNRHFVYRNGALLNKDCTRLLSSCNNAYTEFFETNLRAGNYYYVEEYVIPATVTTIDSSAFAKNDRPPNVSFEDPSNLRYVGDYAFNSCGSLRNTDHLTLSYVGAHAFDNCTSFKGTVTLVDDCTEVPDYAFANSGLTLVEADSPLSYVGEHAFDGCTDLECSLTLGENCRKIPAYAFRGCTGRIEIQAAAPIDYVGEHAFDGCTNMTGAITLSPDCETVPVYAFNECPLTVNLSEDLIFTSVQERAFYHSTGLSGHLTINQIYFSPTYGKIYGHMFEGCTGLTGLTVIDAYDILEYAFAGCTGLKTISINSTYEIYEKAFTGCTGLESITFGADDTTKVGNGAFEGCLSLKEVNWPQKVKDVGEGIFAGCLSLQNIDMPYIHGGGNPYIPAGAFSGCTSLKTVGIALGTKVIRSSAFEKCLSLNNLVIPKSVTTIEENAFKGCRSLTDIYYGGTEEEWNAIEIAETGNEKLLADSLNIHFEQEMPEYGAVNIEITEGQGEITVNKLGSSSMIPSVFFTVVPQEGLVLTHFEATGPDGTEYPVMIVDNRHDQYDYYVRFGGAYMNVKAAFGVPIEGGDQGHPCRMTQDHFPYVLTDGWYEVTEDITSHITLKVSGDAHLILDEGTALDAKTGIAVDPDSVFTITGEGTLYAKDGYENCAIGGIQYEACGDIIIDGGTIHAESGSNSSGAGIGGCDQSKGGTVTINGGTVYASASTGAGIGSGLDSKSATDVTINGGTVYASSTGGAAGIGAGYQGTAGTVTINGGTVTATGRVYNVYDGRYSSPAGIGGCYGRYGGTIIINGGTVNATGGTGAPGIGSGVYYRADTEIEDAVISIADGLQVISGDSDTVSSYEEKVSACKENHVQIIPCPHNGKHTVDDDGKWICAICHKEITKHTAPLAKKNLVYTGGPQLLVEPGSITDGTIRYAVTTDNTAPADNLFRASLPTAVDAGTYYVWYRLRPDDEEMSAITSKTDAVRIEKAAYDGQKKVADSVICENATAGVFVPLPALPKGASYDGRSVTVTDPDGLIDGEVAFSGTGLTFDTAAKEAGSRADITIRVKGGKNYLNYFVSVALSAKKGMLWVEDIPDQIYTGSAIKPEPVVHYGNRILDDKDYTVSYKNNTNAADSDAVNEKQVSIAPELTVKGKGNFSGIITQTFTIKGCPMTDVYTDDDALVLQGLSSAHITLVANGKEQKIAPVLKIDAPNGKAVVLKKDKDYILNQNTVIAKGTYDIKVSGIGNYTGVRYLKVEVRASASPIGKVKIPAIPDQDYTGKAYILAGTAQADQVRAAASNGGELSWELYDQKAKRQLVYGQDYMLAYADNINAGTATVTVIGCGDYYGTVSKAFKIRGISMGKVTIPSDFSASAAYTYNNKAFQYTGLKLEVAGPEEGNETYGISLIYNYKDPATNEPRSMTLEKGTHYTVAYEKNVEPGTASVIFTGKGEFTGTVKKTFKIAAYDAAGNTGNCVKVMWPSDLDPASEKIWKTVDEAENAAYVPSYAYTKGGVMASPVVIYSYAGREDETLKAGKDYTLSWSNNTKPCTYDAMNGTKSIAPTVTITFKGRFAGKTARTFTIGNGMVNAELKATDLVYQKDKPGLFTKTVITVRDSGGQILKSGTDYYAVNDKIHPPVFEFVSFDFDDTQETGRVTVKQGSEWVEHQVSKGDTVLGTYCIKAGTKIKVTVTGKGYYENQEASGTFLFAEGDFSKAIATIPDRTYKGSAYTADDLKDVMTVQMSKDAPALEYGTHYLITDITNNVNAGTAKITLRGNPANGYAGEKTFSFKIVSKPVNDIIHYNGNATGEDSGLYLTLRAAGKVGNYDDYIQNYKLTGTMKDSVQPDGSKLAKNTFKIQKYSIPKKKWEDAGEVVFAGWNTEADGTGYPSSGKVLADQAPFHRSWLARLFYGNTWTMYAQWKIDP